jgi:hypothetical protein
LNADEKMAQKSSGIGREKSGVFANSAVVFRHWTFAAFDDFRHCAQRPSVHPATRMEHPPAALWRSRRGLL